jgi:hypothetical protein
VEAFEMALKIIFTELWRSHRSLLLLLLGGVLLNGLLYGMLHGIMLPGLERDVSLLAQRQAAARTAREQPGPTVAGGALLQDHDNFYRQVAAYRTFPDFIQQLYQYASDSELAINRIAYRPENTDLPDILRYTLEFSVSGPYRTLREFVERLEQWEQLVVVEQIRLDARQPERDEVILSLRLSAYFNTGSP